MMRSDRVRLLQQIITGIVAGRADRIGFAVAAIVTSLGVRPGFFHLLAGAAL